VIEQHLLSHLHLVHVCEGIGREASKFNLCDGNKWKRKRAGRSQECGTESGGCETTEFIETPIGGELKLLNVV
jgi:hypothetical protein